MHLLSILPTSTSSSFPTADSDSSVYVCIVGVLQQLQEGREQLEDLWSVRKMKLDMCLQLRMFEREALEVRSRAENGLLVIRSLPVERVSSDKVISGRTGY